MLYTKTLERDYDEMLKRAIDNLRENTELQNFSAGSIARALLEVYYDEEEYLHKKLSFTTAMAYLSSAEGIYLDEIAKIFNVTRYDGESDDNFRYRIIHSTESLAMANKMALRLACLSVSGVYDVVMKRFTRGSGSFDIYIITEDPVVSDEIVSNVKDEIESTEAFGIDGRILSPEQITIDMEMILVFYDNISSDRKKRVKNDAEFAVKEYISNIKLGSELIINQLIDLVMDVDQDAVKDLKITKLAIDGKQTVINNKKFYWDQRLVPGNIIIK